MTTRKKVVKKRRSVDQQQKKASSINSPRSRKSATMAKKKTKKKPVKNSLIGIDPLAWLNEEPAEIEFQEENDFGLANEVVHKMLSAKEDAVIEEKAGEMDAPEPDEEGVIKLEAVITIREVDELYEVFGNKLNGGGGVIQVDCTDVEKIDASGLQLLVVLRQQAITLGRQVEWISPSKTLKQSASLTGLQAELAL